MADKDSTSLSRRPRRVGIVGFGNLGRYLAEQVDSQSDNNLELAFVWNRTIDVVRDSPFGRVALESLADAKDRSPDIIVEVAHPDVVKNFGVKFLEISDLMVGSPTAFADQEVESKLRDAARTHDRTLFIPSGALWGAYDILKLATSGKLSALCVTMRKHPNMFKVNEPLKSINAGVTDKETVLYHGDVRSLCPLAPMNVNTMAAAAMAAHNLGFDSVQGKLVADPNAQAHTVTLDLTGPEVSPGGKRMTIQVVRNNPADPGKVTGLATYVSFYSSLKEARCRPAGVQFV